MFKGNPKLKNIFLTGFLFSLTLALTAYVNSSFLSLFFDEKKVGLMYTLGFVFSIIALLVTPAVLEKIGSYKFLLYSLGLNAGALLFLSLSKSAWIIVPMFVLYLSMNAVTIFCLDEFLEILSKNLNIGMGRMRGVYLAILSFAWVIAQSVSGAILNNFSFSALYFSSFVIMSLALVFSFFSLSGLPDPKYDRMPLAQSIKTFIKNKNLSRSYKLNFLLQFFYAFMVIYTPIYLNAHLGFSWAEIGVIFTIMLTPFVIVPFFMGIYSDKIGERKMLMLGFAVAFLATLSLFFIKQREIWIWALLLFLTRIGASTIEIMSDVYFFKHIAPENDEFIGIYRNATPVAFILAPLVAFLIFALTPSFNFIFPILSAFMLYGVYLSSTIRKTDI